MVAGSIDRGGNALPLQELILKNFQKIMVVMGRRLVTGNETLGY
jgi:hypothetical protein